MISDYRVILWLGHNSRVKSYYYLKRCSRILILAILSIKMVKNSNVITCSNPFKFNSNSFQFTNDSANENRVNWSRGFESLILSLIVIKIRSIVNTVIIGSKIRHVQLELFLVIFHSEFPSNLKLKSL